MQSDPVATQVWMKSWPVYYLQTAKWSEKGLSQQLMHLCFIQQISLVAGNKVGVWHNNSLKKKHWFTCYMSKENQSCIPGVEVAIKLITTVQLIKSNL